MKKRKVTRAERRQQRNRRKKLQLENIYSRITGDTSDTTNRRWLPEIKEFLGLDDVDLKNDVQLEDLNEETKTAIRDRFVAGAIKRGKLK